MTDRYVVRWRSAARDREVFLARAGVGMLSGADLLDSDVAWVDNADAELPAIMSAAEAVATLAALASNPRFANYIGPGRGDYEVVRWQP